MDYKTTVFLPFSPIFFFFFIFPLFLSPFKSLYFSTISLPTRALKRHDTERRDKVAETMLRFDRKVKTKAPTVKEAAEYLEAMSVHVSFKSIWTYFSLRLLFLSFLYDFSFMRLFISFAILSRHFFVQAFEDSVILFHWFTRTFQQFIIFDVK